MKVLLKRFYLNGDNSNIFLNDKNSSLNNQPASNENWSKRTPRHNQKLSTFRQISNVYAALWEVKTMLATYMIVFIVVSYGTITVKFIALRVKLPFVFFLIEKEKTAFSRAQKSSKQKKGSATTKSEIDCPTKGTYRTTWKQQSLVKITFKEVVSACLPHVEVGLCFAM